MTEAQRPLTGEELCLLGRIHAGVALLDELLGFTIRVIVRARPGPGRVLTSELTFSQKIGLLRELGVSRLRNDARLSGMSELLVRVEEAARKGSPVTYDVRLQMDDEGEGNGRGILVERVASPVDRLEQDARFVEGVAADVLAFLERVHGALYDTYASDA